MAEQINSAILFLISLRTASHNSTLHGPALHGRVSIQATVRRSPSLNSMMGSQATDVRARVRELR